MLYRCYCVTCSLLVGISVILVITARSSLFSAPHGTTPDLPGRRLQVRSVKIRPAFQWATVDPNATVSEEVTVRPIIRTGRGVSDIVRKQGRLIDEEMGEHLFPDEHRKHLSDYVPSRGGRPTSVFILSTWETAHAVLGDIINTLPGNYYFVEPLRGFGMIQLNGTTESVGLDQLRNLMNCNFSGAEEYLKDLEMDSQPIRRNTRLWAQCRNRRQFCYSPEFLRAFCREFPIKTMNVLRLRLSAMAEWLADDDEDVRIVLLVRDPRGLIQSRHTKKWCREAPDCAETARVCQFMTDDWTAYKTLSAAHPGRIKVVRSEDLALDPLAESRKVIEFLRAPYTAKTDELLEQRTEEKKTNEGIVRRLRKEPFAWKERLSLDQVQEIQQQCRDVTAGWGYRMVENEAQLQDPDFIPLVQGWRPAGEKRSS